MESNLLPYKDLIEGWLKEPDIKWTEIAARLSEIKESQISEATVRRFCKKHDLKKNPPEVVIDKSLFGRALRDLDNEQTPEDILRDELDISQAKLKEAEQIIKRLREKDQIENRIQQSVEQALSAKADVMHVPVLARPKARGTKSDAHEFLLTLSDAHYGEVVNPDQALGLKYDTDVCKRRIQEIRDVTFRIAELRESAYPIQKITIASLGDMIGGVIHDELEVTNESGMVDQTAEMAHILHNLCSDMQQVFPEVELIIEGGNHPRIHKKPRFKNKYDNWEFVMGKMIEGMAKYSLPDVVVTVPRDMVYIHEIFNYRVAMVHGDGVKSNSFAGIPFYGLRNQREAVQALMSQTGQSRVDMFMMGHFHQYVYWSGECDIMINGSIKGGDEYGIGTRLSAPDPEQILLEWHPRHKVTSKTIIKLKDIK